MKRVRGGITIEELLESNQPEHWVPENEDEQMMMMAMTNNLTPFWALVRKLIQRGLLKDAWNVLRRHSACVRAVEKFSSSPEGKRSKAVKDLRP